jgi:hypothetical protein
LLPITLHARVLGGIRQDTILLLRAGFVDTAVIYLQRGGTTVCS